MEREDPRDAWVSAHCAWLALLAHAPTWVTVGVERAVSRAMCPSCSMPPTAHAVCKSKVCDNSFRPVWVFSSSEAIENLRQGMPHADWRGAVAVATHPRIAQTAAQAGFGRVLSCGGTLDAVIASIKSLE